VAVHGQDVERCVVEIVTRGHCEGAAASQCASVPAFGVEGGEKHLKKEKERETWVERESQGGRAVQCSRKQNAPGDGGRGS